MSALGSASAALNDMKPAGGPNDQRVTIEGSLLDRAMQNDGEALTTLFRQFIPPTERIEFAEYLGTDGLFGLGNKSFACLTERRLASLRVGILGKVWYQDGFLEHTNSGVIHQPSLLGLYVLIGITILAWLFFGAGLLGAASGGFAELLSFILLLAVLPLMLWLAIKLFYARVKCGFVWWVREGVAVYTFTNRSRMRRANHLYRLCVDMRDERIRSLGRSSG